jgi:hypothetical protein
MKRIFVAALLLFAINSGAQTTWRFAGPKFGLGYQGRYVFAEVGYIQAIGGSHGYALSAGSEFNYNGSDQRLYAGPKASIEYYHFIKWWGPGLKVSLVDHTDFKKHDPYLVPELMIHVIGVFGAGYGYNIHLGKNQDLLLRPTHKVSLFLNMVKKKD